MTKSYQWYYDGAAIGGATGKTHTLTSGQTDENLIECRVEVDYGSDSVAALAKRAAADVPITLMPLVIDNATTNTGYTVPTDLSGTAAGDTFVALFGQTDIAFGSATLDSDALTSFDTLVSAGIYGYSIPLDGTEGAGSSFVVNLSGFWLNLTLARIVIDSGFSIVDSAHSTGAGGDAGTVEYTVTLSKPGYIVAFCMADPSDHPFTWSGGVTEQDSIGGTERSCSIAWNTSAAAGSHTIGVTTGDGSNRRVMVLAIEAN